MSKPMRVGKLKASKTMKKTRVGIKKATKKGKPKRKLPKKASKKPSKKPSRASVPKVKSKKSVSRKSTDRISLRKTTRPNRTSNDSKHVDEETALEQLVSVIAPGEKPRRSHVLREIFKASIKLAKESPGTLNLKIAAHVIKELRYSFKMFYPDRFTKKITIFGSARTPPTRPMYQLAKQFAALAAEHNYMIITGGGPGVMAAGNEGAGNRSFGLNIRLPHEQSANPFISEKKQLIDYKYFFTRKLFLVKEASAFALFPGGFGTMDETFEVLTLIQTGKSSLIPVVLMETPESTYWSRFQAFLREELLERGLIAEPDLGLFHVCHTAKEAMTHIEHFYSNYHSMRAVGNQLSMRFKKLDESLLAPICEQFASLSGDGEFVIGGPLEEEANEPELKGLKRLIFKFDRSNFAGLRGIIDFVNDSKL